MTWHVMKRLELDPDLLRNRPYPVGEDLPYSKTFLLSPADWREEFRQKYADLIAQGEITTEPEQVDQIKDKAVSRDRSVEVVLTFIAQLWKDLPKVPATSRVGMSYPRQLGQSSPSRAAHKRPRHTPLPVKIGTPEMKERPIGSESNAARPHFVFDNAAESILREQRYSWRAIDRVREKVKLANQGAGIIKVYSHVIHGENVWSLRFNLALRLFFGEREGFPGKVFLKGMYHHDHFDK